MSDCTCLTEAICHHYAPRLDVIGMQARLGKLEGRRERDAKLLTALDLRGDPVELSRREWQQVMFRAADEIDGMAKRIADLEARNKTLATELRARSEALKTALDLRGEQL